MSQEEGVGGGMEGWHNRFVPPNINKKIRATENDINQVIDAINRLINVHQSIV